VLPLFARLCVVAGLFLAGCGRENPNEVRALTEDTFDRAIAKGVVLVDFWAEVCAPCIPQRGIVAEIAAEVGGKGVRVAHLDLGFVEAREKVEHLKIEYVPTLIVFKNGKPFKTFVGLTQKAPLIEAIEEARGARR